MGSSENFAEAIATARRRGKLAGMPLRQRELTSISRGYTDAADDRAARLKSLRLQEDQLQMQRDDMNMRNRQAKAQNRGAAVGTGAALGMYMAEGTAVGGPVGGLIGAGLGLMVSASFFCTEIDRHCGLSAHSADMLERLRKYVIESEPEWWAFYQSFAPAAIQELKDDDSVVFKSVCELWKRQVVNEVVRRLSDNRVRDAFIAYKKIVLPVILNHVPGAKDALKEIENG